MRRAGVVVAAGVLACGMVVAGAGPAAARQAVLYAAVTAAGTGDCSAAADACTLSAALSRVAAGGTIELVTPGGDTAASRYVGNWTISTSGTSAGAPVTIKAAPRLARQPVLDGAGPHAPAGETCSTAPSAPCNGPVLTVPGGEDVALSGITIADGNNTSTTTGGGLYNAGTVTIAGCTFTSNSANNGGGIDNADGSNGGPGTGSVTVTGCTFSGNRATNDGGAIDSSESGYGSLSVATSTFVGNTAGFAGAIDDSTNGMGAGLSVISSTFGHNTDPYNLAIDASAGNGDAPAYVAGDVFDGTCSQGEHYTTWTDGGYNAGIDSSCFNSGPGDVNAGSAAALKLGQLAANGGPTQTVAPQAGSKAVGIIPDRTLGLCPAIDQRGYPSAPGSACDAGAVQTSGLALKDSAAPGSFNRAGQMITYSYKVTNTSAGTLTGITVTDAAVPGTSCPARSLAPRATERCTGSRAVTKADLAAGTITDTATASGVTADGVPVHSRPATVRLPEGWPPAVSGSYRPRPHSAEGYYLDVTGSTWHLIVTHPGGRKITFTGIVTLNAGTFRHVTEVDHETGDSVHARHTTLTFRFTNYGYLDGVQFATTAADTIITFTLDINGHPASVRQIHLGRAHTQAGHRSPLTYRR